MAAPATLRLTGQIELGRTDIRSLREIAKNPPSRDSFYTLLQNSDNSDWKTASNRWVHVVLQSDTFDPKTVKEAMNSPCQGSSFQARLKNLSEQGKLTREDEVKFPKLTPARERILLPLSFINTEARMEFRVDDTLFELEWKKGCKYTPRVFLAWKTIMEMIMMPLKFYSHPDDASKAATAPQGPPP